MYLLWLQRTIFRLLMTATKVGNQRALTAPSSTEVTGQEEEEGDEVGVEEIMATFLGRRGG